MRRAPEQKKKGVTQDGWIVGVSVERSHHDDLEKWTLPFPLFIQPVLCACESAWPLRRESMRTD